MSWNIGSSQVGGWDIGADSAAENLGAISIIVGGEWKTVSDVFVIVDGEWKTVSDSYIVADGGWESSM